MSDIENNYLDVLAGNIDYTFGTPAYGNNTQGHALAWDDSYGSFFDGVGGGGYTAVKLNDK